MGWTEGRKGKGVEVASHPRRCIPAHVPAQIYKELAALSEASGVAQAEFLSLLPSSQITQQALYCRRDLVSHAHLLGGCVRGGLESRNFQ